MDVCGSKSRLFMGVAVAFKQTTSCSRTRAGSYRESDKTGRDNGPIINEMVDEMGPHLLLRYHASCTFHSFWGNLSVFGCSTSIHHFGSHRPGSSPTNESIDSGCVRLHFEPTLPWCMAKARTRHHFFLTFHGGFPLTTWCETRARCLCEGGGAAVAHRHTSMRPPRR